MAESTEVQILTALKTVQGLRSNVAHVFEKFAYGMKGDDKHEGKEKAFLSDLQKGLLAVNKDMSELEKIGASVNPSQTTQNLGNSSLLTLDSATDKTPLYNQITQTYKWTNKLHDHATFASALLSQNTLKRSQTSSGLSAAKRTRKAQNTSHAVPNQLVENLIQNSLDRLFPDMSITYSRPFGSPTVLQITLGNTLQSLVVLRGFIIEWVVVKGINEETRTEGGKLDIWSKSRYLVFQKVTDHTNAAMLHFYSPLIPELALRSFMTWFHSYSTLFSAHCHKCGKYLQDNLPPTWRDFRTLDPYHHGCRP